MSNHNDKKERKKSQLKKNRYHQEIFHALRLRRSEADRVEKQKEALAPSPSGHGDEGEKVWSEKVATIRNRLTDQRRTSKERWNRFAGTGGEGGRGL